MKFCIFIPAFNAQGTILETLSGIDDSCKYFGKEVDVIIADDYSTDHTINTIKNHRPEFINISIKKNEKNLGERPTINKYFKELSNNYHWVLLIHADDIPKPEWISELVNVINVAEENVFTVWSSYDDLNHNSKKITSGDNEGSIIYNKRNKNDALHYLTQVASSWHVSGCAINLRLFKKLGGFKNLAQYGDTEYFVNSLLNGLNDIYIRKTLTYYRIIESSVSFVSKNTNRDIKEIFELIRSYDEILNNRNKRKMLAKIINFACKRIIKSLLSANFLVAWESSKYLMKSIFLWLFPYSSLITSKV